MRSDFSNNSPYKEKTVIVRKHSEKNDISERKKKTENDVDSCFG